eukprot:2537374-Alexandrium_andersonii.AAC.2
MPAAFGPYTGATSCVCTLMAVVDAHAHTLQVLARACAHRLRASPWVRPGAAPRVRPGAPRVRPWFLSAPKVRPGARTK